jgi:hypothetical protein
MAFVLTVCSCKKQSALLLSITNSMRIMLKYFTAFVLALALMACQSDQGDPMTQQSPQDQQAPMDEQFQPQQPTAAADVSDEELNQFITVSSAVQGVQMEAQIQMVAIVEEEGLEVDVYNQIAEARFSGHDEGELEVSSEDMEKFDRAADAISEIELEVESEMTEAIEAEGMERERFMEINMALQQDPELQQRIQQMMMEHQLDEQDGMPEPEAY